MKKATRFLFVLLFALCAASLAAEDVVLESAAVKLVLHEQNGSFSLYRKTGSKGKLVALNEVSDNSSSTFFSLKTDGRYRPLRRSYNMTISAVKNDDGTASLKWVTDLAFEAEARFSLLSSDGKKPADTVRVDFTVQNLAEKEGVYSVKAVIDTVLGERSRIHFTTAKGTAIRSEKSWTSMVQDKWLSSSNGTETVSFLLAGSAATAPDMVLVASRDNLLSDTWKPVVNEDRGLTSIQSPNNSAIGIWYRDTKLKLFEEATYTFFMTTAGDGGIAPNAAFIGIETEEKPAGIPESTVQSASQIVDTAAASSYEVVTPEAGKKDVDYAYIQQLLDYIDVLEQSENPDPEEIEKLSAELDAVILELTK